MFFTTFLPSKSNPHRPHVTIMAEVVPQATLTEALANNNALDPPPQPTPPTASSPGSKVDNIDNDGVYSSIFTYST
jgi:hypothetical protein